MEVWITSKTTRRVVVHDAGRQDTETVYDTEVTVWTDELEALRFAQANNWKCVRAEVGQSTPL